MQIHNIRYCLLEAVLSMCSLYLTFNYLLHLKMNLLAAVITHQLWPRYCLNTRIMGSYERLIGSHWLPLWQTEYWIESRAHNLSNWINKRIALTLNAKTHYSELVSHIMAKLSYEEQSKWEKSDKKHIHHINNKRKAYKHLWSLIIWQQKHIWPSCSNRSWTEHVKLCVGCASHCRYGCKTNDITLILIVMRATIVRL